ncbi:hypothetical protein IQ07DRAFT_585651 [Pyrenochaeta sp. DS3sAY3a]|nr:hypothetical protein IQ07DRAFT_585651 [Pyrenochaeta sp. DS3sAY3a]
MRHGEKNLELSGADTYSHKSQPYTVPLRVKTIGYVGARSWTTTMPVASALMTPVDKTYLYMTAK